MLQQKKKKKKKTEKKTGQVRSKFAAVKNGQVSSKFAAVKNGQVSSKFAAVKIVNFLLPIFQVSSKNGKLFVADYFDFYLAVSASVNDAKHRKPISFMTPFPVFTAGSIFWPISRAMGVINEIGVRCFASFTDALTAR